MGILSFLSAAHLHALVMAYGYWAVFAIVALESTGVPVPGETVLVSAAIYAGTTGTLGIVALVLAAAAGAIVGDNVGYWIGREIGLHLLGRYGKYVRLNQARLRIGQYLFLRHGGKIVFFGRFVALLRALAALLAGANGMAWTRFLLFNALGGVAWAALFGVGGYALGEQIHRYAGPIGVALVAAAIVGLALGFVFARHHESRLEAKAERALRDAGIADWIVMSSDAPSGRDAWSPRAGRSDPSAARGS